MGGVQSICGYVHMDAGAQGSQRHWTSRSWNNGQV